MIKLGLFETLLMSYALVYVIGLIIIYFLEKQPGKFVGPFHTVYYYLIFMINFRYIENKETKNCYHFKYKNKNFIFTQDNSEIFLRDKVLIKSDDKFDPIIKKLIIKYLRRKILHRHEYGLKGN